MDEFRRLSHNAGSSAATPKPAIPSEGKVTAGTDEIIEQLTEREMDVLRLIAEGLSNKDIAARLYLSEGTMCNYVSTIMDKMHANDRTQVVIKTSIFYITLRPLRFYASKRLVTDVRNF